MKNLLTLLLFVCATTMLLAYAQSSTLDGQAINKECPIGKGAIDGESFVEYDGHAIGLCCPGCETKFAAWGKDKKDAFVQASLEAQEVGEKKGAEEDASAAASEPYTLATCPVSGEKLGSMGDPIFLQAEGSEVKLCCKGCVKTFESDKAKYMAVVHEGIAAQQMPYYPLDTCLVSGEPLMEDGKDIAVNAVIGNRLFRVCCKSCIKALKKDTSKYVETLDAEVIKAQAGNYPLSTCLVRDKSKLGSMGEPVQRVVGNRLIQFCCKGCEPKFQEDPAKFIAVLDAAWAETRGEHSKKEKGKAPEHKHGEKGHGEGEGH